MILDHFISLKINIDMTISAALFFSNMDVQH